jgi:hypothetical protein
MKQLLKFTFFISLIFTTNLVNAQQKEDTVEDTLKVKEVYGIRFGIDISKPIISLIDEDFTGFEVVFDGRFYKNFYAAIELGFEETTTIEDYLNASTKGSYAKIGVNYNAYDNWAGMTNEIYVGFRYGISFFEQTLNNFTPNIYGVYFIPETVEANQKFPDLNAQWLEFVVGIRAETIKNLYMGFSFSFKGMIYQKQPENFKNLFVPGFNRVYLNNLGFGFNYTFTYLIPYAKKSK